MNVYETDELLGQYLGFHFGESHFGVGNYPARCAGICQELMAGRDKRRALDLGCAVGRTAFALGLDRAAEKVSFATGDASNLGPEHVDYDLVFAGNLIDRLQDPGAFLESIHRRLAVAGSLVIGSPYTLMDEFTPIANWIGGYERNGQPYTVYQGMKEILSHHFEESQPPRDVPFVIRETRRKFQHTIAELSAWRRTR